MSHALRTVVLFDGILAASNGILIPFIAHPATGKVSAPNPPHILRSAYGGWGWQDSVGSIIMDWDGQIKALPLARGLGSITLRSGLKVEGAYSPGTVNLELSTCNLECQEEPHRCRRTRGRILRRG